MKTLNVFAQLVFLVSLPLILGSCASFQQAENAIAVCNDIAIKNNETEINIKELEIRGEGPSLNNPVFVQKKTGIPFSGQVFELYRNGQRRALGSLKNGKHQDSWLFWYDDGSKKCEATFNDGNRNGLWVYWHKNTQKKYIGNYKDGKMDGLWVYWHENGKKRHQGTYKDGEPVEGSLKFWNSKGKPVDSLEVADKE